MRCDKCGRDFLRPLELYTGSWACPHCRKVFELSQIKLCVTDGNEELFTLSEICYLKALKTPPEERDIYRGLLDKAIYYCKSAVAAGHPKAMVRLGYFYETGYFPADGAEAFKMACDYYGNVWKGEISDKRVGGDREEYSGGGLKLKKIAARRYLELIRNAPPSAAKLARYKFENAVAEIKRANLYDGGKYENYQKTADRAAHAADVLQSCYSRERAPLFGLLYLDGADFKSLCEKRDDRRGAKTNLLARYAEKVHICMFALNSDFYQAIKSERDFNKVGDGEYYMYFFNPNGAHRIHGGKMAQIASYLEKSGAAGGYDKVARIVESIAKSGLAADFIFHDDDVLVYKSGAESFAHATGDLINDVVKRLTTGD